MLYEGITKTETGFKADWNKDTQEDIISIASEPFYESLFNDKVYWFGYKFNDAVNRNDRTKFINWLKQINDSDCIDDKTLSRLIDRPLSFISKTGILNKIDCVVSPKSKRSPIVAKIVYNTSKFLSHDVENIWTEAIKNGNKEISFDWTLFNRLYDGEVGDQRYLQIFSYVEEELLPKIRSQEYFSIARDIKPKYRNYIKDFLIIKNLQPLIKATNILVIDDINTTGATLVELLRLIRASNSKASIYVFTLIGKD